MGATKHLILICVVLILALYLQIYLKPKHDYTILQSDLDKLTPDKLLEKYPIVIYDIVQNPSDLMKSLFAYSYISESRMLVSKERVYQPRAKFTLFMTDAPHGCLLHIISPKYKVDKKKTFEYQDSSIQFITIKLKPKQIIIIPMFWSFSSTSDGKMILLDDIVSKVYRTIL